MEFLTKSGKNKIALRNFVPEIYSVKIRLNEKQNRQIK